MNRKVFLPAAVLLAFAVALAWDQKEVKLPPPFATPSVDNGPHVVDRPEGAELKLPDGFQVDIYAEGFEQPRFMALGPGGELLVSDSIKNGAVYVLEGQKERKKLIAGLDRPYGLAFWKDYLYVGEQTSVKRYKYDAKNRSVGQGEEVVSLAGLDGGHWTRSLLFDRKGEKLYVGVGSRSNVSAGEDPRRAAINRYNPDGSGHETFASGTRNPIGLHLYPGTDTLWAAVQERDLLGDDLVPDYFTHIQQGAFYGWPYAYIGPHEDPRRKGEQPDLVAKTIAGDVILPAHVAVLDFLFYTGKQFPAEYRDGAFLALHGSWNRSKRVGQEVAFLPFKGGKPAADQPRHFLTGWMLSPDKREVWGRPVALLQLPDGSVLVSDDGGNKLWRISYKAR
ncbi:MAG TPA: PQQ-dependent sugar dehydrogenase [Bryobacteraceae bacterium]|nr:PQQ-dependent sugar dehydrogenase [Bryobacteraceae bacterium]